MSINLSVENLRVRSRSGRDLVQVDALDVSTGTLLGITGPSGAGKSTLLLALAGLQNNVTGRVTWGATDITSVSKRKRSQFRARQIGLVFQDFHLFEELTAKENAALVSMFRPKAERQGLRKAAAAILGRLGLDDDQRAVGTFSGGERQRVAVARALVTDPPVILADEPTASLHRNAADTLARDLHDICRRGGKTLIVVSHDDSVLGRMDRVLTLRDGRVEA
ncbi:ABC transporter ATP-binding protein [Actibacterium mucosum KCTC 23349]|uniref:ABC transporter ATP-binding protein n=1 Tax=Actibacterium mucosum KCTC 23349 TaxID=1454373 RepID=A0A037ZH18_9RHOB|nr:ATP-binding cassette domain-containing protein [Actibacterium mucosum]KAJ54837.1 ABC transporter ATP-binding protein [Actibacterium mucosum KCTC 23349]